MHHSVLFALHHQHRHRFRPARWQALAARQKLQILLQTKRDVPFEGELGLPGKLILPNEDNNAALREMMRKHIGTDDFYRKELKTFSALDRHPLGRIITFAYYGLIPFERLEGALGKDLHWCPIRELPSLCADHNEIVKQVFWRFRKGLLRHPLVFQLLPSKFALSEIIAIYEQAFGEKMDKPNFRKKVLNSGLMSAA